MRSCTHLPVWAAPFMWEPETRRHGCGRGVAQRAPALFRATMGVPTQPTPKGTDMTREEEIADIKAYCERLRADLSATNTLLLALYESMPVDQQEKVLPKLAAKLAEREQLAGRQLPPEVERAMERIESAVERLWNDVEATHRRSRAAKMGGQSAG